ncbi:transposase (plasmid) [Bacillus mycoides]|nr:transposase [Bacillus mycoides]
MDFVNFFNRYTIWLITKAFQVIAIIHCMLKKRSLIANCVFVIDYLDFFEGTCSMTKTFEFLLNWQNIALHIYALAL